MSFVSFRKKQAGFTLIELLVVLSIMGVLMVVLFSGLRFGNRAWERSIDETDRLSDIQAFYRISGDWMSRMYPVVSDITGENEYVFSGSSSRARFAAFMPSYPTRGGLYLLEFAIENIRREDGENNNQLVLYKQIYNDQEDFKDRFNPESRTLLIDKLAPGAAFDYFGALQSGQANIWSTGWQEVDRYPDLIRFRFSGGGKEKWPDLIVPVRVNMDGTCLAPEKLPASLCRKVIKPAT